MPATTTPAAEKHQFPKELFASALTPIVGEAEEEQVYTQEASTLRLPPGCMPNRFLLIDVGTFILHHIDRSDNGVYMSVDGTKKAVIWND